ncbi:hypothetical protein BDV95DRAFT_612537 [Massariosphaeria phaeospora]|uniref:NAD(P)-binding protein n=1 Tax=Massariosphaeria phaeospora TaxID=100035 RepID=A0A7C8HYZ9_9PLEO|nr:hypothetical protein BDV95DRAFT_612537 [Massariosphaeria phaeospora]
MSASPPPPPPPAQVADPHFYTRMHQFTPSMRRAVYPAIEASNPQNSVQGLSVLVTGATRGIGKAIALAWAQAGASRIAITGRDASLLAAVSAQITAIAPSTTVFAAVADAGDEAATRKLWADVQAAIGRVDVLVCNAGVFSEGQADFPVLGVMEPGRWWADFEVNVRGPYLHIYSFLQQFRTPNDGIQQPTGTVIVVTSGAGALTMPGMSAYSISKLADLRLSQFLHAEHPTLRTFALHPGMAPTDMAPPRFAALNLDPPELAAGLTLYMAQPRADFLRGRYVSVNWDVEEMERHSGEIVEKGLLGFVGVKGEFGAEGHGFEGEA